MATPNIKEIEWAISELEQEESSKSNYIFLAALYTCRDYLQQGGGAILQREGYSASSAPDEPLGLYGESNFLREVYGKAPEDVWAVMDELMDTLRAVNPRVYESVIRKIQKL